MTICYSKRAQGLNYALKNKTETKNKTKQNYSLEFIEEVEPPTNRPEAANFSERPTVSNTTSGGQARRWMAS